MSALAKWFHANNFLVGGYDKTQTPITEALTALGIHVHYHDGEEYVSEAFKDKHKTLIVYTPAIPLWHKELNFFQEAGFQIRKRAV